MFTTATGAQLCHQDLTALQKQYQILGDHCEIETDSFEATSPSSNKIGLYLGR